MLIGGIIVFCLLLFVIAVLFPRGSHKVEQRNLLHALRQGRIGRVLIAGDDGRIKRQPVWQRRVDRAIAFGCPRDFSRIAGKRQESSQRQRQQHANYHLRDQRYPPEGGQPVEHDHPH